MTDYTLTVRPESTSLQCFAIRALALFGWRVKFAPLPGPRGVVIAYPHTSNWDVVIGLLAKWAVGIHFRWLGKEALFRGVSGLLLGPVLRAWGCEPIERHASTGAIDRLAKRIRTADFCWLALAPEGTRKYRDSLRSGFYHIARGAGVPLGLVCFDYAKKEVRLVNYVTLSGDIEADLARIRAVLGESSGLRPEWASPVRFAQEQEPRETAK